MKRYDTATKSFIKKAKTVHSNKYDYTNTNYLNCKTKVEILCKIHGSFWQTPSNHLKGSGCPDCGVRSAALSKTKNINEKINKCKITHGNKYEYFFEENVKNKDLVKIKCKIHGHFHQSLSNHMRGAGCKLCGIEERSKKAKRTTSEFIRISKTKHGNKYDYSKACYQNRKTKITIICRRHGEFKQLPSNHYKYGCPSCGRVRNVDDKELERRTRKFVKKSKDLHKDKYDYSLVEIGKSKDKIKIICFQHGEFEQIPYNHLKGYGCPICGAQKQSDGLRKYTKSEVLEKLNKIFQNEYQFIINDEKPTVKQKIFGKCKKHGLFKKEISKLFNAQGCNKCNIGNSYIEDLIGSVLDKYNINYLKNDRKVIHPFELDFYLQNFKLAIECNGIYWHSELQGKDKKYHLNKTNLCNNKGIKLIHIFENEAKNKQKIVISRLKNILNLNKYRIFARRCKVREVLTQDKNTFLEKYHLQGPDKSSVKLGLFYKNRLVAVMTFCKNRKALGKSHVEGEWELSRFVTISNFSIIGGAGKLLKYFERNWKPKRITSYADKRWSQGHLYEKLGFIKIRQSKPNYWYFKKENTIKIYHRFGFRKSELPKKLDKFDPDMTEWENMKENGWDRIWDCGNLVFEKKYE